jgi:enoyl-CoA hydratase/carnithine racemase
MSRDERANARATEERQGFAARPQLADYQEKYARFFKLERRDGVLEVRMHTDDGPAVYGFNFHNAWAQLWADIGGDPDNEVLILTGTGEEWMDRYEDDFPRDIVEDIKAWPADSFLEHAYIDATKVIESFVFNIDIPTIACLNGPGFHTDVALLCDITLCAPHATLSDLHFAGGVAPGDGQALTFQELIGIKRAAYYMYTSEAITAQTARDLGLVHEVLATDALLPRAREIAAMIMQRPRHVRRFTSALVRRQWKRRLVDDLSVHVAHEMLGIRMGR